MATTLKSSEDERSPAKDSDGGRDLSACLDQRAEEEAAAPPSPTGAATPAEPEPQPQVTSAPQRPSIPTSLQGATPDEQIAFLNQWYPIVRERIPQRTSDPARLEALTALAERLNPAAWTDADQIAEGLLRAAEALERLSRVFARRRRRRRTAKAPAEPQRSELSSSADS